jgi:hypothetical protein
VQHTAARVISLLLSGFCGECDVHASASVCRGFRSHPFEPATFAPHDVADVAEMVSPAEMGRVKRSRIERRPGRRRHPRRARTRSRRWSRGGGPRDNARVRGGPGPDGVVGNTNAEVAVPPRREYLLGHTDPTFTMRVHPRRSIGRRSGRDVHAGARLHGQGGAHHLLGAQGLVPSWVPVRSGTELGPSEEIVPRGLQRADPQQPSFVEPNPAKRLKGFEPSSSRFVVRPRASNQTSIRKVEVEVEEHQRELEIELNW